MAVDLTYVDVYGVYSRHLNLGKKQARTHGGEYSTSCPWCGGTDRFQVWPFRDDSTTTYWCRKCSAHGDVISFIQQVEGKDFLEACEVLNIDLGLPSKARSKPKRPMDEDIAPSDIWQTAAIAFAKACKEALWSDIGKNARAYLYGRGLTDSTIKRAGLGYNPATRFDEKQDWGVTSSHLKKIWIPRGITFPWVVENQLWKLSIRRPDPDIKRDTERGIEHPAKYVMVAGSSEGLYGIDRFLYNKPTVLVEGEFDKLILSQVVGNRANVFATGSTSKGRDEKWVLLLAQSPLVLIAYDADEAGHTAAQEYWLKYLPNSLPWQPWGHDMNEMFLAGVDMGEWLDMGIEIAQPSPIETTPPDIHDRCHSCRVVFPSFEGWEVEDITAEDVMSFDPQDGHAYCPRCRPDLFAPMVASQKAVGCSEEEWKAYVQTIADAIPGGCSVTMQPVGYTPAQYVADQAREAKRRAQEEKVRQREAYYERLRQGSEKNSKVLSLA